MKDSSHISSQRIPFRRSYRHSMGSQLHRSPQTGIVGAISRILNWLYGILSNSPARIALMVFLVATMMFATLLAMPFSAQSGQPTPFEDALLVATSAISVTGLTSVNTPEHWSGTGQVILLAAIQIGGMGIVSMAALLTMAVSRRLGLRSRLLSTESINTYRLGEVRSLLATVIVTTLVIESALAMVLIPQMVQITGSVGEGFWRGTFYSISAFCNAGFTLNPEGFGGYLDHPLVINTVNLGVILGALGFPVILVLHRKLFYKEKLNLHTKLTIQVHLILLVTGLVLIALFEWNNPATLGQYGFWEKIQNSLFASGMTRSGGFNVYPMEAQNGDTMLLMEALMFVGGGSGSTAGGIKVTTLAVLLLAIFAETRGAEHVTAHHREISSATIRIAIAVLMAGATIVLVATMILIAMTGKTLNTVLFEVLSAFATVGLSDGLTEAAPPAGKVLLSILMFIGRVGTITLASGLALRHRPTLYRLPAERPIIG